MKSAISLIASLLLLAGCSAAPSSVQPDVQKYTKAEQKQAAKEMSFCDHVPMLCRMIVDYGIMRDQARQLQK